MRRNRCGAWLWAGFFPCTHNTHFPHHFPPTTIDGGPPSPLPGSPLGRADLEALRQQRLLQLQSQQHHRPRMTPTTGRLLEASQADVEVGGATQDQQLPPSCTAAQLGMSLH